MPFFLNLKKQSFQVKKVKKLYKVKKLIKYIELHITDDENLINFDFSLLSRIYVNINR